MTFTDLPTIVQVLIIVGVIFPPLGYALVTFISRAPERREDRTTAAMTAWLEAREAAGENPTPGQQAELDQLHAKVERLLASN